MGCGLSKACHHYVLATAAFVHLLVLGAPAQAQDAGSLLREQERREELQRLERLTKPEEARPEKAPERVPETGETILVKEIRYTGKTELLTEAERSGFAAEAEGQRLGVAGLQALADRITFALQQKGHLLARAVLPSQDITEGVVHITILEGLIEHIEFEPGAGTRIRNSLLRGMIQGRITTDSPSKRELEGVLLRINDLPGVSAKARLQPGEAADTSRLVIGVEQAPILSGALSADNFGSESTGEAQGNAQLTMTDVTGGGDLTRLSGDFSEGQAFGQVTFSVPLGASGFTTNVNYGYLRYRNIDDTVSALELEGHAHYAGAGLDYSLIRSRQFNLRLNTGVAWKALVDESLVGRLQDKRSLAGNIGISGDRTDTLLGGGLTWWSLGFTYGDLDLSREASALAVDQAGLKTQGEFHRVNASLVRLQDLPGAFSLFARVYGQWANRNLDSSEDFSLGGHYGVRGWPVGEGRGDMGALGTLELRYDAPIPPQYGHLQLKGFFDGGHVWVNENPDGILPASECGCNNYGLRSGGIGTSWTWKTLGLDAAWARGIGDNPGRAIGATNEDEQFWLQAAVRF